MTFFFYVFQSTRYWTSKFCVFYVFFTPYKNLRILGIGCTFLKIFDKLIINIHVRWWGKNIVYNIHLVIFIIIYIYLRLQLKWSTILNKLYCNFSSWWAIEVDCLPITSSSLISLFKEWIKRDLIKRYAIIRVKRIYQHINISNGRERAYQQIKWRVITCKVSESIANESCRCT